MKITPPQVARLLGWRRERAWERALAGDFGPAVRIGRPWYVDLAGVEAFVGRTFTETQIAAALTPGTTHVAAETIIAHA